MKVLITGANGFLAANVARELLLRGFDVRGMVRKNCDERAIEGLNMELVHGNIVNYADVLNASMGCNAIIHAAADTSQHYSYPEPLLAVNLYGTENVVKAANANGIQRLVFVSTANTLGLNEHPKKNSLSSLYHHSGYALSKLKAEELILSATSTGTLKAIIVNPTFLIGPFDAKPSSGRIFMQFLKPGVVFYPKGGKNFIDVQSAAIAICNALERGQIGHRYVLAGENRRFKEFIELIENVTGKRKLKLLIPSWLLLTLGGMGSCLRFLGFKAELNYYNAQILLKHEVLTGELAEKELLMPKTNVTKATIEAISWFKENGYFTRG